MYLRKAYPRSKGFHGIVGERISRVAFRKQSSSSNKLADGCLCDLTEANLRESPEYVTRFRGGELYPGHNGRIIARSWPYAESGMKVRKRRSLTEPMPEIAETRWGNKRQRVFAGCKHPRGNVYSGTFHNPVTRHFDFRGGCGGANRK